MFIIDDLLLAPARGLMFVLKKIDEAVQKDLEAEERAVMADLTALHRALDGGEITERGVRLSRAGIARPSRSSAQRGWWKCPR